MPIYDYRCDACGHAFSAVRSYTDGDVERCPSCGARPRKLMASPAIVFKGSGWYKTDSRARAKAADESKDGKDGKDGKDATPAKTGDAKESKPAEAASEGKSTGASEGKAAQPKPGPKAGAKESSS